MLSFSQIIGSTLSYRITGKLTSSDLTRYYATVDEAFRSYGRLNLTAEAIDFRGYAGVRALLLFLRHEPGLIRKVKSYRLYTNQPWLRSSVAALGRLIPGTAVETGPLP